MSAAKRLLNSTEKDMLMDFLWVFLHLLKFTSYLHWF